MSQSIPESHADLINHGVFATLTTIAPTGQPENTIVWFSWDGEHVLVNTAAGRRKWRNVQTEPRVALTVIDPKNGYRWLDIRGRVEAIEPDPNSDNISAHAKQYVGVDRYYGGVAPAEQEGKEERVIMKIRPERVVVQ